MEYYKITSYNSKTFVPREIESSIPKEIVDNIKLCLDNFDETNWLLTPLLIDPSDLSIVFGIHDRNNDENKPKYTIKISKK